MVFYPQQWNLNNNYGCFGRLPRNITLINEEEFWRLGPVDLVIAGWPCQGHSRARASQRLEDPRSSLIWDLILFRTSPWGMPKIPWAQRGPRSDTADLWRHWWEGPSDPNVGEDPRFKNTSHPRRLRGIKVRPLAICSSWGGDSRMLKNTSIGGVS